MDTNGPEATGTSKIETGCTGDFIQIEGNFKIPTTIQQLKSQPIFCYSVILASLRIFLFHLIGSMFQPQK